MPVFKFFLLFILILGTGYFSIGYCFPKLRPWIKTILSFPVGSSLYLVYTNCWIHLAHYDTGIHLGWISLLGHGVFALWKTRVNAAKFQKLTPSTSKNLSAWKGIAVLVVLSLQGGLLILSNTIYLAHDILAHGVVFSQYNKHRLSYPVDTIHSLKGEEVELNVLPKRLLYHYGYDLINASSVSLSDIKPHWAYFIFSSLSLVLILAAGFLLVYHSTGNFLLGLGTIFLLPFDRYLFPEIQGSEGFRSIFPPLGTYINFSILQGTVLIFLATLKKEGSRWSYIYLLTVLIVSLELVNESLLVVVGPAAFITLLICNRKNLTDFLLASGVSIITIYWFGGIIGGILRGDSLYTYVYPIGEMQLRIRFKDFLHIDPFYGHALPIYMPKHLLANLILPLSYLAFFAMVYWFRKKRLTVPLAAWQLWLVSAIGILIPGTIDFGYPQNVDAIRFVYQTCWAMGPLGLVSAYYLAAPWILSTFGNPLKKISTIFLLVLLVGIFAWSYPISGKTFQSLYSENPKKQFKKLRSSIVPQPMLTGIKSQYYYASQNEYADIMAEVRRKQRERNVFIPWYDLNTGKKPEIFADAGLDVVLTEKGFTGNSTVLLDGSQSQTSNGEITSYIWKVKNETLGEGEKIAAELPIGTWNIELIAKNKFRNWGADNKLVKITPNTAGLINRALAANGGAATSYLNHSELPADNAIDGKIEGGFNEAWISDPDKNAWWQVDLGPKPAPIKRIIVYFRSDYKTADQTNHISLLASNDPNFEDFKILAQREDENYPAGGAWLINTNHETPYRYLKIAKNQNSYTSLVEVQIWCTG